MRGLIASAGTPAASDQPADPAGAGLRRQVANGLAWKAVSGVSLQVIRFAGTLVLARMLTPHDYGLASLVLVFGSLVLVFSDMALGVALVQRRTLTESDRSTVFWASLAVGGLMTLVGIAVSGPVAAFYGQPHIRPLIIALSFSFVIAAVASTQTALLTRDMNFRTLELRQVAATAAGLAAGIALAVSGTGPWALIGQQIAWVGVSAALLWVGTRWRPSWTFSLASLRSLAGYSGNVFGARLLFYVDRNADNVLVGRFLGAAPLGVYTVAYNLMQAPFNKISLPAQDVVFPAFSRMTDPARLGAAWLRANRLVAAVTVPLLTGLALLAPEFVTTVLGERWRAVTPVLRILCWVGLIQSLQGMNGSVLRARDRTSLLLRYSIVVTVATVPAFVVGLPWGIVGVSVAYALASTVVEPYYTYLTAQSVGLTLRDFFRPLRGVAEATVMMAAVVFATRLPLQHAGAPAWLLLLLLVPVGAAAYLPACAWRAPEVRRDARRAVAGVRARAAGQRA